VSPSSGFARPESRIAGAAGLMGVRRRAAAPAGPALSGGVGSVPSTASTISATVRLPLETAVASRQRDDMRPGAAALPMRADELNTS
jgi:hypothetical protein